MFRNLAGVIGPNSDITVVSRWSSSQQEKEDQEEIITYPKILLLDPYDTFADEATISLDSEEQVITIFCNTNNLSYFQNVFRRCLLLKNLSAA